MAVSDLLRKSELFAGFDEATVERLAEPFHEIEAPANQVLIEPRQIGAGLFVICDGTVEVEIHDIRRELGPGDVVGEISLVEEDHHRRARVVTKTPVTCLALSRTDFDRLTSAVPEFDRAVRELAEKRLAELAAEGA